MTRLELSGRLHKVVSMLAKPSTSDSLNPSPLEAYRGVEQPLDFYVKAISMEPPPGEPVGTNLSIYAARLIQRLAERSSNEYDERFDLWLTKYIATRRSRGLGGRPHLLNPLQVAIEILCLKEVFRLSQQQALDLISQRENVDIRTVRSAFQRGVKDPRVATLRWTKKGGYEPPAG